VYSFDPLSTEYTAEEKEHIIGGQANLWREWVVTDKEVEFIYFFIYYF
jgi:hexosaminidase